MTERTLNFSQQVHLFDARLAQPVTVIGAGSVGSWLVRFLAKNGCTDITVIDADDVASHNVPPSAYGCGDLGKLKVEALAALVLAESGVTLKSRSTAYGGETLSGSVACCVDSMDVRTGIWKQVRDNPLIDVYVDTRTHMKYLHVLRVFPCDKELISEYEKLLYPSSEAEIPLCGRGNNVNTAVPTAWAACALLCAAWKGDKTDWQFRLLTGPLVQITP